MDDATVLRLLGQKKTQPFGRSPILEARVAPTRCKADRLGNGSIICGHCRGVCKPQNNGNQDCSLCGEPLVVMPTKPRPTPMELLAFVGTDNADEPTFFLLVLYGGHNVTPNEVYETVLKLAEWKYVEIEEKKFGAADSIKNRFQVKLTPAGSRKLPKRKEE